MSSFFMDLFKNKSTSLVDFRTFHEEERDIYPSFSLCLVGPEIWNANILKKKYGVQNYESYVEFLRGEKWNESMLQIDYDNVTVSLEDYVEGWMLWIDSGWKNPTFVWYNESDPLVESQVKRWNATTFTESQFSISLRTPDIKCFTLDFKNEMIPGLEELTIKNLEILVKRQNKLHAWYLTHYPKQLIAEHFYFDVDTEKSNLEKKTFVINMIEVIRRRHTNKDPCLDQSSNHDLYILTELLHSAYCKPPYLKYVSEFENLEICNDSISMQQTYLKAEYLDSPLFRKRFNKPCDQVESIVFNTKEFPRKEDGLENSSWILEISFFNDIYKEIRHTEAYGLKSCWSDVSAIVGFVCGVSMWQIPDALKTIIDWIKHRSLSNTAID